MCLAQHATRRRARIPRHKPSHLLAPRTLATPSPRPALDRPSRSLSARHTSPVIRATSTSTAALSRPASPPAPSAHRSPIPRRPRLASTLAMRSRSDRMKARQTCLLLVPRASARPMPMSAALHHRALGSTLSPPLVARLLVQVPQDRVLLRPTMAAQKPTGTSPARLPAPPAQDRRQPAPPAPQASTSIQVPVSPPAQLATTAI